MKDPVAGRFWLGNLSDGSGMVSLTLAYTRWKDVRISLGLSRTYGQTGSEFAMLKPETSLTVEVSAGGTW